MPLAKANTICNTYLVLVMASALQRVVFPFLLLSLKTEGDSCMISAMDLCVIPGCIVQFTGAVVAVVVVLGDFAVKTLHYLNCHSNFPCFSLSSFLFILCISCQYI